MLKEELQGLKADKLLDLKLDFSVSFEQLKNDDSIFFPKPGNEDGLITSEH